MVAIGIVWIPVVKNFSELFHYIQSITSYLAPPVCAIYILAVGWKRTNEQVKLLLNSFRKGGGITPLCIVLVLAGCEITKNNWISLGNPS